jgi:EAL domain-containing protein (putative c-di-GMP-specific phosphodiesterase class I)
MATLSACRLLVVDDEPSIGRVVERVGKSVGFDVIATVDSEEFIRIARRWHPTVIILDLNIPGADGVQLLRALAADRCAARVILSSGADSKVLEAVQRLGRERGLDMGEVLQKPVRLETLRELLLGFGPVPKTLLAAALRDAIGTEELYLEFQPKLDCQRGRITAVEALARWRSAVHGVIPPDEFVPLAEDTGAIRLLTDWVVATAAQQAAVWRAEGLEIDIAVNISAADVEDLELPDRLEQHCRDAGVDPSGLILELTETGAMREAVQMMDVLTRLRLKGFHLSIDDFGTGYSSLVQLQRMPFSEIKIDKSFVMHMSANSSCRVIVEIIIDLAKKLGLRSVAEGVEDEATLNSLVALGCDMAQGYHLSRPVSAARIAELVAACGGVDRSAARRHG